jgi:3-hydroxyisobutyrate dehydrogenase-like beta-hydroxyacid dehydrogenase
MDLSLPCLAIVKQFYVALRAQGGGKLGTQSLIKVY